MLRFSFYLLLISLTSFIQLIPALNQAENGTITCSPEFFLCSDNETSVKRDPKNHCNFEACPENLTTPSTNTSVPTNVQPSTPTTIAPVVSNNSVPSTTSLPPTTAPVATNAPGTSHEPIATHVPIDPAHTSKSNDLDHRTNSTDKKDQIHNDEGLTDITKKIPISMEPVIHAAFATWKENKGCEKLSVKVTYGGMKNLVDSTRRENLLPEDIVVYKITAHVECERSFNGDFVLHFHTYKKSDKLFAHLTECNFINNQLFSENWLVMMSDRNVCEAPLQRKTHFNLVQDKTETASLISSGNNNILQKLIHDLDKKTLVMATSSAAGVVFFIIIIILIVTRKKNKKEKKDIENNKSILESKNITDEDLDNESDEEDNTNVHTKKKNNSKKSKDKLIDKMVNDSEIELAEDDDDDNNKENDKDDEEIDRTDKNNSNKINDNKSPIIKEIESDKKGTMVGMEEGSFMNSPAVLKPN